MPAVPLLAHTASTALQQRGLGRGAEGAAIRMTKLVRHKHASTANNQDW